MPSQTFLNLAKEKQDSLLKAAFDEFSNYSYQEASINRIIKKANIPRGSFYAYFQDKQDLYFYLLDYYLSSILDTMKEKLKDNNGDIFLMFKEVFVYFSNMIDDEYLCFFKKTLENITIMEEKSKTFGFRDKKLLVELIPGINLELLTSTANRQIEFLLAINMHLLLINLIKLFKEEASKDIIMHDYYEQVDLLKFGAIKEREDKVC